jgi:hypothetical protein
MNHRDSDEVSVVVHKVAVVLLDGSHNSRLKTERML